MPVLDKKDMRSLFFRSFYIQHCFNYARMQGLGFFWVIKDALRKIHTNEEDYKAAAKRHTDFLNTHPYVSLGLIGIVLAMEEHKEPPEAIRAMKIALMGPFAAIGDSISVNWRAVTRGIVGGLAISGGLVANETTAPVAYTALFLAVIFPIFNILRWINWFAMKDLYEKGSTALDKLQDQMKVLNKLISYIGLISIGGLTAGFIKFSLKPEFQLSADKVLNLQTDILDKFMPGILSIATVMILLYLVRKKVSIQKIIWGIIVFSLLSAWLGIFTA